MHVAMAHGVAAELDAVVTYDNRFGRIVHRAPASGSAARHGRQRDSTADHRRLLMPADGQCYILGRRLLEEQAGFYIV